MSRVPADQSSTNPRHRVARRRRKVLVGATAAAVVGAGVGTAVVLAQGDQAAAQAGCADPRVLQVAVAPALADTVGAVAKTLPALPACTSIKVAAVAPHQLAARGALADVWIPDSSAWLPSGRTGESIAHTTPVLAVGARVGRSLGPDPSYERLVTASGFELHAADARTSMPTRAAFFDLESALNTGPTERGRLATLLRDVRPGNDLTATTGKDGRPVAVVTTEQAVRAAGRTWTALRADGVSRTLDYPYVVLAGDRRERSAAALLERALTSAAGRKALRGAGFETGPVDSATVVTKAQSRTALRTLTLLNRPSRLLALIDVSGSMDQTVPGAGGTTRIDLARQAIGQGLQLLPPRTVAGLWRFSTNLTPSTDYQQVTPVVPLNGRTRAELGRAVAGLQAIDGGGTGLYGSVLAAVRSMRQSYDPTRVNSVVVLTDGRDEAATLHGITFDALLQALRAEADPARPVRVIAIAYGPDSDAVALGRVAAVTGGAVFTARDPRDLPVILSEALGQRLCGSGC